MNNSRKNKQWMRNKNQMKNRKMFQVTMVRNSDGSFNLLGGQTKVLSKKNQHSSSWVNVDTRDFATEMRNSRITSL